MDPAVQAQLLEYAGRLGALAEDAGPDDLDAVGNAADFIAGLIQGNEDEQTRVQGEALILHDLALALRNAKPILEAWGALCDQVANAEEPTNPDA